MTRMSDESFLLVPTHMPIGLVSSTLAHVSSDIKTSRCAAVGTGHSPVLSLRRSNFRLSPLQPGQGRHLPLPTHVSLSNEAQISRPRE